MTNSNLIRSNKPVISKTNLLIFDQLFFYFSVLLPIIVYTLVFNKFFVNNDITTLNSLPGKLLFASKFVWFTGIVLSLTNIIGLLFFGSPTKKDIQVVDQLERLGWNPNKKLIISYVSRGDNRSALSRAVKSTAKVLNEYQVNYHIEIVTDIPVASVTKLPKSKISFYVVPESYKTNKDARYKARALHYLVESRDKGGYLSDEDTWILHLDEESIVTKQSLGGIAQYINDDKNRNTIGQGEIKYNSYNYSKNLFITVIDNVRTGDDLGRFRFQFKLAHAPLFGMHGSYFLVPEPLENKFGFDLGGKGSITEDAYFALHATEGGIKFHWINGYIKEQSPFTLGAILKQRRRWYCGLMYLSFDKNLKLRTRLILLLNMLFWTVSWSGPVFTLVNLVYRNSYSPSSIVVSAAIIQGTYCATYMVGAYRGFIDAEISMAKKILVYISTFILFPISNTVEGLAIIYGIIKPVKTFDVVKK